MVIWTNLFRAEQERDKHILKREFNSSIIVVVFRDYQKKKKTAVTVKSPPVFFVSDVCVYVRWRMQGPLHKAG